MSSLNSAKLKNFLVISVVSVILIKLVYSFVTQDTQGSESNINYQKARKFHSKQNSKSLEYYKKSLDQDLRGLMYIGDIYHYGLNDIKPNLEKAHKIYNLVFRHADNQTRALVYDKLTQLTQITQPTQPTQPIQPIEPTRVFNTPQTPVIFFEEEIFDDPQNVHDTGLNRCMINTLNKIKSTPQKLNKDQCYAFLTNKFSGNILATSVLDEIYSDSNLFSSHVNHSAIEILTLVVNRINTLENKDQLYQQLEKELESCIENGKIVCSVGVINRIIDTLNILDPEIVIKPRWALRKELLELGSKIYSECANESNESLFETRFRKEAHETYIKPGLVSKETLDAEIQEWIKNI